MMSALTAQEKRCRPTPQARDRNMKVNFIMSSRVFTIQKDSSWMLPQTQGHLVLVMRWAHCLDDALMFVFLCTYRRLIYPLWLGCDHQYNIFFQLERAFILQVNLDADTDIDDAAKIFHPDQPTYAGLPPLPSWYASLILPYDWFLPGKEQRRKRKHRVSHGAISFRDLSALVAAAWRNIDDDAKFYCSQVCAAGKIRYKTTIQEWRRRDRQSALRLQVT